MTSTATLSRRPKIIDSDHEAFHERHDVPPFVSDAIRTVRDSGWCDMWDRETVMMLAATYGHDNAAEWLAARRHLYFIALRRVTGA